MTSKTSRFAVIAVVIALVAGVGYWYYAPHLAMRSMRAAAVANDADAFNEYIDYPRLRESVKGQLNAMVTDRIGANADKNGFAALGTMLGLALVDKMVDAMVRPEVVMKAMQQGKLRDNSDAAPSASSPGDARAKVRYETERKGRKFLTYIHPEDESRERGIRLPSKQ